MNLSIANNHAVEFHYRLYEQGQSKPLETSYEDTSIEYLHTDQLTKQTILPGLHKALTGRQAGDELTVELTATEAYGLRHEDLVQRVPIKHLQGPKQLKQWQPGMLAQVQTDRGLRQVIVTKVGRFMADVDMNHPLAGKDLRFEIEVLKVRPASNSEIAHGHVHTDGASCEA